MAKRSKERHAFLTREELKTHMVRRLEKKEAHFIDLDGEPPTIHKVPRSLRQGGHEAYDPKLISIGPLHYRSKAELTQTEDLKWRYLRDLIDREPKLNSLERYIDTVWKEEERARKQYSSRINLEPSEFVELLVLDGCFLIEFLIKLGLGFLGYPWTHVKWNLPMLRNDLLLLENQIPFFVLEIIYQNTHLVFPTGVRPTLLELALRYLSRDRVKVKDLRLHDVHHLLHLDYLCKLRNFHDRAQDRGDSERRVAYRMVRSTSRFVVGCFFFFLSCLLMCKRPRHYSSRKKSAGERAPRTIPTATSLRNAGVRFKRREHGNKEEFCFLDVSFSGDGRLEMPFLPLGQSTISSFRNLVALEQCCPGVGSHFTAYAIFMDKIIDTPGDVSILVRKKIIESKLGTNEDVAQMFNNICKGAYFDYDRHYLADLFTKLNAYCESDANRWRAAIVYRYFYSPWARISFIAVIFMLMLSIVETGATIWQTVFTVRSYARQFG